MSTIGEQIIERINGIERRLDVYDRVGTAGGVGVHTEGMTGLRDELKSELDQMRARMEEMGTQPQSQPKFAQNPKDWMPETLAQQYKDSWRNWSYKTRDWARPT